MLPIKLVTFDITGTILFFRTPIYEKYIQTGLKFGIQANSETLGRDFREVWKTLNVEHPNFGKDTGLGWQSWWGQFVERTFMNYTKPGDEVNIPKIVDDLISYHTTKDAFTIRPGTEDLLQHLKTKTLKLGVISNYDPRLHTILEQLKLSRYFDFVLLSYEFGHCKPDRRIFEEALRLGGCKAGGEAIHVGNDLDLDYLGAKKAGLKSFLISSNPKDLENDEIKKSEVFQDFFSLKNYFQVLLNPQSENGN